VTKHHRKHADPAAGLNPGPIPPAWQYDQEVRIASGKHAGAAGKLKQCREEGRGAARNMRAEVETPAGRIWCDLVDLEQPPGAPIKGIGIFLMIPEEDHADYRSLFQSYKDGDYWT
jgi:hypothetical protein